MECHSKDVLEEVKRVLIHWVDVRQISQHEEETGYTKTNWNVFSSDSLYTLHNALSFGILLLNLSLLLLGFGKRLS